ncbi:MAG: hypothetical protein RLZZ298_792, partial [Pseudomonadota bacterium]
SSNAIQLYRPWVLSSGGTYTADSTGNSRVYFSGANASLTIPAGQTLTINDVSTDTAGYFADFDYSSGNAIGLVNNGTLAITGSSSAIGLAIYGTFTNNGNITLPSGTKIITLGGSNNVTLNAATTFTGSGTFEVNSGTTSIPNDLTLSIPFELTGGTLNGAGNLTLNGPFKWTGGNLGTYSGTNGSFTTNGTVTMDPGGAANYGVLYLSRPWNLNSASSFLADGASNSHLYFYNSAATVNVASGQTLSILDSTTDNNNYGAYFDYSTTNPGLVNAGSVALNGGDFYLAANFTNTGTVNIANASNFRIAGGTTNLGGATTFAGSGSLHVSAGTANATSTINPANLIVDGGTLNLNSDMTLSGNVSLSGGTLGGTGNTIVSGPFSWTGGNLGNSTGTNGSFTTTGTVSMDPGGVGTYGYLYLYRPWNLNSGGSFVADGNYHSYLYFYGSNAALNIPSTKTLAVTDITTDSYRYGVMFAVSGTNPGLVNSGNLQLLSGDWAIYSAFSNTASIDIATNSALHINGGTTALNGGTIFSGGGVFDVGPGTVNVATPINPAILVVSGGTLNLNSDMNLTGNVSLNNGTLGGTGNTTISGPFSWTGGYLGNSTGTNGSFTTTGSVTMDPGGAYSNGTIYLYRPWNLNSGASFIADGTADSYLYFYNAASAINVATGQTLSISDTTSDAYNYGARFVYSTSNPGLVNAGTVALTLGDLYLSTNFTNTGTVNIANASNFWITGGTTNLGGSTTLPAPAA